MADDDARSGRRRFLAALAAAGLVGCTVSRESTPTGSTSRPPLTASNSGPEPPETPVSTDTSTEGDDGVLRWHVGLDRSKGTRHWSTPADPTEKSVTVTSEHVYVGGISLERFDATTGEETWDRPGPGWTGGYGVPVVDGFLYVGVSIREDSDSLYDNYVGMFG